MKAKAGATGGKGGLRRTATNKNDYAAQKKVNATRGPAAAAANRKAKAAKGAEGPKKSAPRKKK